MIVFPLSKPLSINRIKMCLQCNKLFIESVDTKDHGICSLSCGYAIRGFSWVDFAPTRMDEHDDKIETIIGLGKY
ncbi:hypothetical protein [Acinetobacter phage HFM1]|nr:hypothetical protein [Acinetobacter phage HFM1]